MIKNAALYTAKELKRLVTFVRDNPKASINKGGIRYKPGDAALIYTTTQAAIVPAIAAALEQQGLVCEVRTFTILIAIE